MTALPRYARPVQTDAMFPDACEHMLMERLKAPLGRAEMSAVLFIAAAPAIADAVLIEGDVGYLDLPLRKLIDRAVETQARQILLLHTHPSGNPRPSRQDVVVTRRFCSLLRQRGIRLMDHLILTQDRYFSFRAHRML